MPSDAVKELPSTSDEPFVSVISVAEDSEPRVKARPGYVDEFVPLLCENAEAVIPMLAPLSAVLSIDAISVAVSVK
jgi:hypothetical protein